MPHGISDAPIHLGWGYHLVAAVLDKVIGVVDYVAPTKHVWRGRKYVEVPNPTVGAHALVLAKHALGRTLDISPILALSCPNGLTATLALANGVRTALNASRASKIDLASSAASILAMASKVGVVASTPVYEAAPYCYNATNPIYNIRWGNSSARYEDCIAIPAEPVVNCPGREIAVYGESPGSLRSCESIAERCKPGVLFQSAPNSVIINDAVYTQSQICFTNPGGPTEFTPLRLPGPPQYDIGPVNYNAPSQFANDCLRVRGACAGYTPVPTTAQVARTSSTAAVSSSVGSSLSSSVRVVRTTSLPVVMPSTASSALAARSSNTAQPESSSARIMSSLSTRQTSHAASETITSIAPTTVHYATLTPSASIQTSSSLLTPGPSLLPQPSSSKLPSTTSRIDPIPYALKTSSLGDLSTSASSVINATGTAPSETVHPSDTPDNPDGNRTLVIAGAVGAVGVATGVVIITGAGITQCIRYHRDKQRRHVLTELAAMY